MRRSERYHFEDILALFLLIEERPSFMKFHSFPCSFVLTIEASMP